MFLLILLINLIPLLFELLVLLFLFLGSSFLVPLIVLYVDCLFFIEAEHIIPKDVIHLILLIRYNFQMLLIIIIMHHHCSIVVFSID